MASIAIRRVQKVFGRVPVIHGIDLDIRDGEFVVLVEGATLETDAQDAEAERILKILLTECSVKQAANLAAQITGRKKNALYERALQIKGE